MSTEDVTQDTGDSGTPPPPPEPPVADSGRGDTFRVTEEDLGPEPPGGEPQPSQEPPSQSADATPAEGEGAGPKYTIPFDGKEFPAELKDGKLVSSDLEAYMKAQRGSWQSQMDTQRGTYEDMLRGATRPEPREAQPEPSRDFGAEIKAVRGEANPHERTMDPDKWMDFELDRRDRISGLQVEQHEAEQAALMESFQLSEMTRAEQDAHVAFDRQFAELASRIGIPRNETQEGAAMRRFMALMVARDPRLRGFNDDIASEQGIQTVPMEDIAQEHWKAVQGWVDHLVAQRLKDVATASTSATPSPHRGGSPSVPPPPAAPERKLDTRSPLAGQLRREILNTATTRFRQRHNQ